MNGKRAKMLRKAAGYRNQTATPGVMDFPGIARAVKVPVFATHEATKTSYEKLPMDTHWTKVYTKVRRLDHGPDGKPVLVLDADGTPKYQLEALSKPGVLRPTESKGVYRQLKKFAIRHRLFKAGQAHMLAKIIGHADTVLA